MTPIVEQNEDDEDYLECSDFEWLVSRVTEEQFEVEQEDKQDEIFVDPKLNVHFQHHNTFVVDGEELNQE